jgi:ABC-type nitrate/sulfonate/bicarbonate transport system substrate-binding protein
MIVTRRTALAATLVGGLLPLAGRAQTAAPAGTATPVSIAVSSNSLAYGGVHIALRAGLFEKQGLALKIVTMDSGNAAMAAVLSGSAEFVSAGPSEVMAAKLRGQNIVIVANIYRGLSGSLVLAKSAAEKLAANAASSIEARLKALDGLVIATPSATSSYTLPYKSAAAALGVNLRFTYMAQPAMLAALEAGAIQGMIAGAPFSVSAVNNGRGVLWISGPRGELPASVMPRSSACIETSEAYASAHPDVVARIQAAFNALSNFVHDQPEEAQRHLAAAYPSVAPAILQAVFRDEAQNWARPVMSVDDVKQEIAIQASSGSLKGVESVSPESLLVKLK